MYELQSPTPLWPSKYEEGKYTPSPQTLLEYEIPKVQGALHGAALRRFERQMHERGRFARDEFVVVSAAFHEIGRAALSLLQTEYPNLPPEYEVTPEEERNRRTIYGDPTMGMPGFVHMTSDYQNLAVAMALDPRGGRVLAGELDNPVAPVVVARTSEGKVDLTVMSAGDFAHSQRASRLLRPYTKEAIHLRTGAITPVEEHPQYQVAVAGLGEIARRRTQEEYEPLAILPPHLSAAEAGLPSRPFPQEAVVFSEPAPWPTPPEALRIGTPPGETPYYLPKDAVIIDVRPLLGLPVPPETQLPGVVYPEVPQSPVSVQGWAEVSEADIAAYFSMIKEAPEVAQLPVSLVSSESVEQPPEPRKSRRRRSWRNYLRMFKWRSGNTKHRADDKEEHDEEFWARAKAQMAAEPQEEYAWSDEGPRVNTTTDRMKQALAPISGSHEQEVRSQMDDIRHNLAVFLQAMKPSGTRAITALNMKALADTIYDGIKVYICEGNKEDHVDNGVHPTALSAATWLKDAVTHMGGRGKRGARRVIIEALGDFRSHEPPIETATKGRLKLRQLSRRDQRPQLVIRGGDLSDSAIKLFIEAEQSKMLADR